MYIEKQKYQEIIGSIPILCIDLFIVQNEKFLLGKRTNAPWKGEWCVPGGRLMIGEKMIDGMKRKLLEEVGIEYYGTAKILGVYDTIFDINSFEECKTYHTVNVVYILKLEPNVQFIKDYQNQEFQSFEIKNHDNFTDYINQLIKDYISTNG